MFLTYLTLCLAAIFGIGGLLAFMRFLYFGPFSPVNLNLDKSEIIWVDTCLCLAFFIQHSVMIRKPVQDYLIRIVPGGCVKAVFAIFSGLFLYIMVLLWQSYPYHILIASGMWQLAYRAVFFIGLLLFCWGIQSLGFYDPTGIKDAVSHIKGKSLGGTVVVRGPY